MDRIRTATSSWLAAESVDHDALRAAIAGAFGGAIGARALDQIASVSVLMAAMETDSLRDVIFDVAAIAVQANDRISRDRPQAP